MNKSQLLNFFRVTLLLLIFSAFTTSAWAAGATVTIYFDNTNTQWPDDKIYLYMGHGGYSRSDWQMTKVSGNIFKCDNVTYWDDATQIAFAKDQWSKSGANESLDTRLVHQGNNNYTKAININKDDATAYIYKPTSSGNTYNLTQQEYNGGGGSGDSDDSGNCNSIEIYCHYDKSDNHDMNLYMWNNGGGDYTTWPGSGGQDFVQVGDKWYAKWVYTTTNNNICVKFNAKDKNDYKSADKCGLKSGNKYYFSLPDGWGDKEPTLDKTDAIVDCGGSGDTPSGNLPTSKGECQKIEIYSKNNYNLYVFKDGSTVGPNWEYTQEGESVSYDGSPYYKWTICKQDNVQIIFRNSERNKQSGNSPVLYGGYKYFFEEDVEVVENGNSNPIPNPKSYKEIEIEDCSTTGACYNFVCEIEDEDVNVPELPAGIVCDASNKNILFFEDFGTLSGEKSRKQNNTIDSDYSYYCGTEQFVTSYNFVDECTKIKNAGEYAIVANPRYSGCSENYNENASDVDYTCNCDPSDNRLWYKNITDHTRKTYGGMLQFDCRDGNNCDVLYQRTLSNVCENAFLNFSAWVAKANISDTDPIKARFLLRRGGGDGKIIGKKDVKDIDLDVDEDDGWVQISAMFNTGDLNENKQITVQLINLAPYGQKGNDILLDDLELAACTPEADLFFKNSKKESIEVLAGSQVELEASILSGILTNEWWVWQRSEDGIKDWKTIEDEPQEDKKEYSTTVTETTYYRALVFNAKEDADYFLTHNVVSACGMYAKTNVATVIVKGVSLESSVTEKICENGKAELKLTVTNTLDVDLTNVKVTVKLPEGLEAYKSGTEEKYTSTSIELTISSLEPGIIDLKTSTSLNSESKEFEIESYISSINNTITYTYDKEKSKKAKLTVNPNPIIGIDTNPNTQTLTCNVRSITLSAKGATTYTWTGPQTGSGAELTINESGDYTVKGIDGNGCSATANTKIDKNDKNPTVTLTSYTDPEGSSSASSVSTTVITCANDKLYFETTTNTTKVIDETYRWSLGGTSSEDVSYSWTLDGDAIDSKSIAEGVVTTGKYVVTVKDLANGCTSTASVELTSDDSKPTIDNITTTVKEGTGASFDVNDPNRLTCDITKLELQASVSNASGNDMSYQWNTVDVDDKSTAIDGAKASTYVVSTAGKYQFVATDNATGCSAQSAVIEVEQDTTDPTVTLKTKPQQDGSPMSTELNCRLKTIPVMADTENSPVEIVKYEWSNGGSVNEYNDLTAKGTYTVTVTGKNGCTASSTLEIKENIVKPILSVEHIGSRTEETTTILNCNDQSVNITSSVSNVSAIGGSVEYFWYKDGDKLPENGETLGVSEDGTYKIVAVGKNNCESDFTVKLTKDDTKPKAEIVASAEMVTCSTPEVNLTVKTDVDCNYFWTGIVGEDAKKQTLKVEEGGTYTVFVQSNVNGCKTTLTHTLEQHTDLPTITIASSQGKVTCNPNTLTASGANEYVWNTGEKTESIVVTTGGTYTVTGTNEYGCETTKEIVLEENKLVPTISLTADTTHITCRKEIVTLTAEVTNADASRSYAYKWAQGSEDSDVTSNTFEAKAAATYKVTVTDTANACTSNETIVVNENKQTPSIETKSLDAVCLPATVDIKDAITSTNAEELKYYADKDLIQEVTNTVVEAASDAKYYVVGYEVDNNGCATEPIEIAINVKPVSATPTVTNYDECAVEGTKTLSSLVTSDKTNLVFFADATSEEPIADEFDASAANTSATYWVSNTEANSCESERAQITVDIAGYIDFTLEASETRVPAGKEITVTLTPLTDTPVEQYIWTRNDDVISDSDETTISEQIYLTSKYAVQAVGRCNSPKQEVDIEAVWPTAFTPYNGNGKNDDFARGMHIIVFNRFYTKIFEGPDGWDGTINGTMNESEQIAVPGVYYYSVKLPNGEVKKGTVEIVNVD